MPLHKDPIKELHALESRRPQEPFLDRPRRPNGYRYTPEYQDWEKATQAHERELLLWWQANLLISSPGPGRVEIRLANRRLPGCQFEMTPEGYARIAPEYAQIMYPQVKSVAPYWTKPLEVPGRTQKIEAFAKDNRSRDDDSRSWDLSHPISHLETQVLKERYQLPGRQLRSFRWQLYEVLEDFIGQVRELLDPEPFRFLNRLNGGAPGKPWTLLDYNLAVHSRDVLEKTAAATPGAVAVWLYLWQEQVLFPTPPGGGRPYREQDQHPPPVFPEHPAEVIKPVKDWFDREAATPCWKALATQPAEHVRRQLRRQRNIKSPIYDGPSNWNIAIWMAERLRTANIKGKAAPPPKAQPQPRETPPPPRPEPAAPTTAQLAMLETGNAPAAAPEPHKPEAAAPRPAPPPPPEPPLPLKLLLADLRFARTAPGVDLNRRRRGMGMPPRGPLAEAPDTDRREVEKALDHLVELALRHHAGDSAKYDSKDARKSLQAYLENITDYCWGQPAQALQSRTLPGIAKASERWHQDHVLRQIAAQLAAVEAEIARAAEENSDAAVEWTREWPCPLYDHQEQHWQARYLPNAYELLKESIVMDHCVGAKEYRYDCESGHTRIFHLQPRPPGAAADWQPNLAQARQEGSTLDLYCPNPADRRPRWQERQHRCYKNALPTPEAQDFATRLAQRLSSASRQNPPGDSPLL